jgi:hypothetical protein
MPTIIKINGFRFFFYTNEHLPIHVHIEKEGKVAKYNLEPVELIKSSKFNAQELRQIRKIIEENKEQFIIKWNEDFNN